MSKKFKIIILLIVVIAVGWGIGKYTSPSASESNGSNINVGDNLQGEPGNMGESDGGGITDPAVADPSDTPDSSNPSEPSNPPESGGDNAGSVPDPISAEPDSITVMVNKQYGLPDNYKPTDLVYPDVRFTFKEKIEKRMMRSEAAKALEKMFAGAEEDGIYLAGVSAYRSQATQTTLYNRYVERDGEEKARTYSAVPGYSEHQTGLAIDVSGSDGKCAAESCFGGTKEAEWLAKHVGEYGFIIRYPEGKQDITGYKYEPWHIRYVGKDIAAYINEKDITLEEYYDAIPVSK
ncbi:MULTISPECIES: M15 family metallopeptidase [Paenibacillus]|uniref:M15 family metallopeptidase n=1 Tax=Paenibacillus TaxID=44249 RepID=UPI0003E1D473|nr:MULTISPECIES: M15 family metallopeptidase [Paenibacillus]ETT59427.1 peptidase M15B and M15C DD-carboxypeptidase VanY/endolysin [Paenibacillus sp. FSL H8-237]MEC0132434.1 M15 family metallopeptidase [Paenibacillus odorifer]MEC0223350.1 M15 family metallopeptidase [Paenibacillus odorifer]OME28290.1 peptidase M15 [Paenibacillus odorifer]OME44908.1 peptidase M15 [Paenibacillus odorifer]